MCYCHILRYCNLSKRFALRIFSLHVAHCWSKWLWMLWWHQITGKWRFHMKRKKDHRSWVWSILAQCQNTWLLLVITRLATKVCNKWCATANFDHLCHREIKKKSCILWRLRPSHQLSHPDLSFFMDGRAAAHLLRGCDSNCIPAASRACVLTCLSTTLAWSRSPATPGTKTGPVGETRRISFYSKARGLGAFPICPFYIPYSALAHNGWVGLQLECRAWMHFLLLLIVWV